MGVSVTNCADKDDRRLFRTRPLPDQRGRLKPVHPRHVYIEKNDGEILLQETAKRFFSRGGAHQIFVKLRKNRLMDKQFIRPIIDDENIDLLVTETVRDEILRH